MRLSFSTAGLLKKCRKKPAYSTITAILFHLLSKLIGDRFLVRNQEPITLESSEPEPDLAVVIGDFTTYRNRHPSPKEVLIVIEVSDATLVRDRGKKQQVYAQANIPEYWVVNLVDSQVEVFSRPMQGSISEYGDKRLYSLDDDSIEVSINGENLGTIALNSLFE